MTITRYQSNIILNQWFNTSNPSIPANIFIGLSTTTPVASSGLGFTEPTAPNGGNYARVAVPTTVSGWSPSTQNFILNVNAITFNESTTQWGSSPITHVLIFDSLTGGNLLWFEALSQSRSVAALTTVNFAANTFKIELV